jgi:hypothetical protein
MCCEKSADFFLEAPEMPAGEMEKYLVTVRGAVMWLREVHHRLNIGSYENEYDFAWDMRLAFTNALLANDPGSQLHEAANAMLTLFDALLCDWVYNPQDKSLDNPAPGPWLKWTELRYFDQADEDKNTCCATGKRAEASALLECDMCQDQYLPSAVNADAGQEPWFCTRCSETKSEESLKELRKDIAHSVEGVRPHEGIRYAPALSLGPGWCQALEQGHITKRRTLYFSPLGYPIESKEHVPAQKGMEREINENLVKQRAADYKADIAVGIGKKYKEFQSQGVNFIGSDADPRRIAVGQILNYSKPEKHSFLWFGNKDDDNNNYSDQAPTIERSLFKKGDEVMAGKYDKKKGSIFDVNRDGTFHVVFDDEEEEENIRMSVRELRLLSNADPATPTRIFLKNDTDSPGECCADVQYYRSVHPDFLPKTGYYGLHLREIRLPLEGLPNASRMSFNYIFHNAQMIYDNLRKEIEETKSSWESIRSSEKGFAEKVEWEMNYWKAKRQESATAKPVIEKESIEERGVVGITPLFSAPDVISKDSRRSFGKDTGERFLCLWDFMDLVRPVIGDPVLSFEDLMRSTLDSLAYGIVPTAAQSIYDDIGIMLTHFLVREVRVKCGFDGKSNHDGQISAVSMSDVGDVLWQELLSYKPINALTWPSVAKSALLVVSNEMSVEEARHLFKFPLNGDAAMQSEIMCLMCAHPLAVDFFEVLPSRGQIVPDYTQLPAILTDL